MEAIVLAGGLGTRLRASVPDVPKPMAPVDGRPFLEHVLDHWLKQGVARFILSVGYRHEQVRARFGGRYRGCEIAYAIEKAPLGTGGGLLNAVSCTEGEGPLLVLNGDTWFGVELQPMLDRHDSGGAGLTIALFQSSDPLRYQAVTLDREQRIVGWVGAGAQSGWANGGVYLFRRGLLREEPGDRQLSLEREVIPGMLATGEVVLGFCSGARFIDIGVPADYERASAFFRDG